MKRYLHFKNSKKRIEIGKIFCLGLNYEKHINEMDGKKPTEPVIFMKPATAVIGSGDDIIIPLISKNPHYEVELVVIIGKGGKNIPESEAYKYIIGYAVGIDVTLRDIQKKAKEQGRPWTVAKGFDTSAPISEVVRKEQIKNPHNLNLKLWINSELRQSGNTKDMIFKIDEIISYLSKIFTIEKGDIIFTGTPEGVGKLQNGDEVCAEIEGIVDLECNVIYG